MKRQDLEKQKDALIMSLLIAMEGLISDDHIIKHSSTYKHLKRLYFTDE